MDALENDNAEAEAADDDSEYEVEEGEGVGTVLKKKGGGKGGKRTTRGASCRIELDRRTPGDDRARCDSDSMLLFKVQNSHSFIL